MRPSVGMTNGGGWAKKTPRSGERGEVESKTAFYSNNGNGRGMNASNNGTIE